MTLRRALIQACDRPGGRGLLSQIMTRMARKWAPGARVHFLDAMWVHEQDGIIFVDSPTLDYHRSTFRHWQGELQRDIRLAAEHWFHAYQPHPGDVILDVGAGKGEDTIAFARAVGPNGKVFAIEAHPVTFRYLEMFCRRNHLHQVIPLHLAINDRNGPVTIETTADWQANRIGSPEPNAASVLGTTLDALIRREGIERIDFLKMNIEGAEVLAVRGMEQTFRITRVLCISCHDFLADRGKGESFRTKATVQNAVKTAGFRIISRDGDPRRYVADQLNAVRF